MSGSTSLPTIDTYAFPVTIPSSNTTITMRPFLVREEKILLLAQESKDYQEQVSAVSQIIINCTNGQVDPVTAPYFDIEYLLIQLRARSVNDKITPIYQCNAPDEKTGEECGHRTTLSLNLYDVHVASQAEADALRYIDLNDRYKLTLRYPNIYTMANLLDMNSANRSEKTTPINHLVDIFDVLEDTESGSVYDFNLYSDEEKVEFLDNLSPLNYEKIIQFVTAMPTVKHTLSYTCDKCQTPHVITLSGLPDFLG
jgi:hypothetical protein